MQGPTPLRSVREIYLDCALLPYKFLHYHKVNGTMKEARQLANNVDAGAKDGEDSKGLQVNEV